VLLLLLWLLLLELSAIAQILLLLWSTQLTPGGVYTMRYLGGAPLELPLPADLGIILFLFFSPASTTAFIILSWSMARLTNSLYDKLVNYTRHCYRWMVSPARYMLASFLSMSTWYDPILSKGVEQPRVVEYTVAPLLKVQELWLRKHHM
jgi:hypothetical protein